MSRVAAAQRRSELIEATIRIAVAEGLEAATVRRIAQEAGVSLGTVHYCFASKAALIAAVAESIVQPDIGAQVTTLLSADEALAAAFRQYWRQAGSDRRRQLLIYELFAHLSRGDENERRIADGMLQRSFNTALSALEDYAAASGRTLPADPMLLARAIIAVTDGVSMAWIVDEDDVTANRIFDLVATMAGAAIDQMLPRESVESA